MRKLPLPSFALDNEKIGGVKYRCGEGFACFRFCMERWERPMESALTGEKRIFSTSMSCRTAGSASAGSWSASTGARMAFGDSLTARGSC